MRILRSSLNVLNTLISPMGVQICSTREIQLRSIQLDYSFLKGQSNQSALRATFFAFTKYLSVLQSNGVNTNFQALMAESYEEPENLLAVIREISASRSAEIDRFMLFLCDFCRISQSQWLEDAFVTFFSNRTKFGRYLEIGAADGLSNSNTLVLRESFGWSGVLIEPDPTSFSQLARFRGRGGDTLINAAAGPPDGEVFVTMILAEQLSCVEGREPGDFHASKREQSKDRIKVPQIPFAKLMKDCGPHD